MAARRTLDFLPSIFQTDTNKKFLSATLDQLVSEPDYTRLNGYVGRKFAPTYKAADSYVTEANAARQNYQLEPSLVIKNSSNEIEFCSSYTDIINKIGYYGGLTNDHNRLFANEYYAYNNLIDQDKFVNFSQYYWLPNGPRPVLISSDNVVSQATFDLAKDIDDRCYRVGGKDGNNPEIVLARGGLYKFKVSQPGSQFYIQTEPGVTGKKRALPTVSSREVYGVTNNGADTGIVEFRVPLIDTQDVYLKMPMQTPVDYAINTAFTNIDGRVWTDIVANYAGFDGMDINPNSKSIVFLNNSSDDSYWQRADGSTVDPAHRRGVWRVRLTKNTTGQDVVNLDYIRDVKVNNRIYSRIGRVNANREYYRNSTGQYMPVPALTAQLDVLYYQDATDPNMRGTIRLVNTATDNIYVDTGILGKINYTSPAGIDFTNGLVIQFDSNVEPAKYANNTYIVEGVGRGIRLVNFDDLKFPEPGVYVDSVPYDTEAFNEDRYDEPYKGPSVPQYLTMNRGTLDLNAWARHNRWFHISVLIKSAELNGTTAVFNQATRAQRPIIEFEPDIQLLNNGRIGKSPVDHIDTMVTDAFNQVQHSNDLTINGVTLEEGQRILFPNDKDPLVRAQVYKIQYSIQDEPSYASIYDGTCSGTVTIEAPTLNYMASTGPTLVSGPIDGVYEYQWTVSGSKELLTAQEITGLKFPSYVEVATVFSVDDLGANQYRITFGTDFVIGNYVSGSVYIKGTNGSLTATGVDTLFLQQLEIGSGLFSMEGEYLGTVSGIQSETQLQFQNPSKLALTAATVQYRDPRIQLLISDRPDDALEPYDCVVATTGMNKGNTFWYNGTAWAMAQFKNKSTQTIMFDAFDSTHTSFSSYRSTKFAGTKIFSYRPGTGAMDSVLDFPISYTTNTSIADITFDNNFGTDTFEYLVNNSFVTRAVDSGYLRQNTGRYDFVQRNTWSTVNEPSRQYQIISKNYTGRTNHFEIDVLPAVVVETPTVKVFLNNNLLTSADYILTKVGKKNTVKIQARLLTVGDKVDILIFGNSTSRLGYYQLPTNLNFNSKNEQFATLTLGQLRNNIGTIGQSIPDLVGSVPGDSNLRDLDSRAYNGNVLQNSSPVIYAGLFLINNQTNFISGLDHARREYTKFKNKFLEMCMNLPGLDPSDAKNGIDKILRSINAVKNKSFPWYYSDMVPNGEADVITYTVLNTQQRQYKINSIFNDTVLQNRAVLVYHNNRLLVKDRDFYFDKTRPAVQINDHVVIMLDDQIEIRDYANTDGNYIPETPTKLGLYPKFMPGMEIDTTYRNPIEVIQGHDGSLTPAFGDHRDQYLLELEYRIYNNIKLDGSKNKLDIKTFVPGRFRSTDYSLAEFNRILNNNFLRWAGASKIDYISNNFFVGNDAFSYNYRYSKDSLFKESMPGAWRGIYQYFYDTDRPHSHPWEMLGFAEQPLWWEDEYGPAPYTSGNMLLWDDLEKGLIKQGPRAGTHEAYARPGLVKIIPVDAAGDLVPPLSRISTQFNNITASESWQVGDVGPVEAAWRRTSEYAFALQSAAALMKPGVYFGTMLDTNNYIKDQNLGQYVDVRNNRRITPATVAINGESTAAGVTRGSGYINWIVDYMTSLGIVGTTKLRNQLDSLQVQLSYKVAGYTDKKYLTVLAEQYSPSSTNDSVIIPDDSYEIYLNKSVPTERMAYSAVIVEKTNTGYSVSGYNINNPYFTVVPSEAAGDSYDIKVDTVSATIYKGFKRQKLVIPYGTEFKTRQQVVDFLVSYQRYLFAQGFVFDEYDDNLSQVKDWILSAREFITWTLQGWKAGNVIILSPVNTTLKLLTANTVVDQITNDTNGSKILDPNFAAIRSTDISVLRDKTEFKLESITGKTVAFAELNLVQFEHVLVFENNTIFNDVIYQPASGSRQYRLKLVGSKTANWDGSLSPAGFVYNSAQVDDWRAGRDYLKGDIVNYKSQYHVATQKIAAATAFDVSKWRQIDKSEVKTGLLPNFANNAGRFIDVYDPDTTILDTQMARMSSGLIGFRPRNYLTDLNVNITSQTKFYQGYIKEKGTRSAITNLLNATFNDLSNDVTYNEEWAVRVGEYGATESNRVVEIELDESVNTNNPTGLSIVGDQEVAPEGIVTVRNRDLWDRSYSADAVKFINRPLNTVLENDIQTAGYVNIDDVDSTLFDSNNYQLLDTKVGDIGSGHIIWVAKDQNKDWNIYRASETETSIVSIAYGLDSVGLVTTKEHHGLAARQTIIIKNLDSGFDGFYTIRSVIDLRQFTIQLSEPQIARIKSQPLAGSGVLFALHSVRFGSPSDIANFTPRHGWKDTDRVWVDRNEKDLWAVYEKNSVWNNAGSLDIRLGLHRADLNYGTSIKLDNRNRFVVVGAAGDQNGMGRIHVYHTDGQERGVLRAGLKNIAGLGKSVDMAENHIVAGAPDSYNTAGAVIIFRHTQETFFTPVQVITNPDGTALSNFGTSVSVSTDSKWLYVGSPGTNKVHYYRFKEYQSRTTSFDVNSSSNGCIMPYAVDDVNSLAVYIRGNLLVLGQDYTFDVARGKINIIQTDFPEVVSESGLFFEFEDGSTVLEGEFGLGVPGTITVLQRSYYAYVGTQSMGSGIDQFGHSVKCSFDGRQFVVGSPGANDGEAVQAGKAYVFSNNTRTIPTVTTLSTLTSDNPVYRAGFGSSVDICSNTCSVYVGAPGYSDLTYAGGRVHRYVNAGRLSGIRLGSVVNPTVTPGHSIVINNVEVVFTGQTLQNIISNINAARIVGVVASNSNNKLLLRSDIEINFNKLNVIPGVGSAFTNLGINIFEPAQVIFKPIDTQGENFGQYVKISPDAETLAVSSTVGTAQTYSKFDSKTTTFDGGATLCLDITRGTGAVYLHDFLANSSKGFNKFGNFVFSEGFNAPSLKLGDLFGCSVDFNRNTMFIGASYNDIKQHNAGNVYRYTNATGAKGWNRVREQLPVVDVSSINSISLYNKKTQSKIVTLDYIDPIKGKALGIVEESLNYKSSSDPAAYNTGSRIVDSGQIDFHWGVQQVGQTWWNLNAVRFVDYEQSGLSYRLNNWGRLFPGSTVEVYEWVESLVLPAQWVSNGNVGEPLHADNSAYVQISYADSNSGIIKTKYYFWVRGLTTVDGNSGRRLSVRAIEDAIEDPKGQALPYAAVMDNSSLALFNCNKYLSGTDVILKVDYDHVANNNVIHSEFELIPEGSKEVVMPARIVNKLVDSIAGIDKDERRVPDAKLKASQSIGLEIRPKQTLVIDRHAALKNIVEFVNSVFDGTTAAYKLQNNSKFAGAYFFASQAEPTDFTHRAATLEERGYVDKKPGDRILVANDSNFGGLWTVYEVLATGEFKLVNNQTYKTPDLWNYVNWYTTGYDAETKPNYIVDYIKDIEKINPVAGDIVRINSTATGGYEMYRYTSPTESVLIAVENGTIKLSDKIWDTENNNVGFDNNNFEEELFDRDYGIELRNILTGLEKEMFVDDLLENYNKLLFVAIRYILSEQQNVDWIFKTSFISVLHKIKELKHYPNFIRDNHDYYEDYINEVKPYRTKIRDYRIGYTGMDTARTAVSDFDLPGYYDRDLKRFRSPSTEYPTKDGQLFLQDDYIDWANNFTFRVENITVADGGVGYTQPPQVQVIANGDSGRGATASAVINEVTGAVTQIYITNAGAGYRNTPYIIINGDGAGARAYARLANNKIRSIKTTLKFDRVGYTTDFVEWQPNVSYAANAMVSYQGRGYRAKVASVGEKFSAGNFVELKGNEYTNANDRVAATYLPGPNQIPRQVDANGKIDLTRLIPGLAYENNVVTDNDQVFNETASKSFGAGQSIGTNPEDINIAGGAFFDRTKSYAPEELVPGVTIDGLNIKVQTNIDGAAYIYRIVKDSLGETTYLSVSAAMTTELARDLRYNDTKIYLQNGSAVSSPNVRTKTPGIIYINGERIKFWEFDPATGIIENPVRGIDATAQAEFYPAGTVVEDQSKSRTIPGTTVVKSARFVYTAKKPMFSPNFDVSRDMDMVRNTLRVFNGPTLLTLDSDYTLSLTDSRVTIGFVDAARFEDGIRFSARYVEDRVWLNPGADTVTDGSGLEGSTNPAAEFVKSFPHILT